MRLLGRLTALLAATLLVLVLPVAVPTASGPVSSGLPKAVAVTGTALRASTVTYSYRQPARAKVNANGVNVRSAARITARRVGVADLDVDVQLTGRTSGVWKQVRWRGGLGWIHQRYLRLVQPAGRVVTVTVPRSTMPTASSRAGQVVAYAKAQLGKPYVWGANGPTSYDCSGLTKRAFARVGVTLPRYSGHQSLRGRAVAYGQWKPGDLLFWGTPVHHVGVYIGDGLMISAKGSAWGVVTESVAEHLAYDAHAYVGARRYV